jgi:hypothetical protein
MFLLCSRVLLLLVGLLIAIIPWSERYCTLDNFPQGQDFETNLLAFLAIAGLMLLLAHLCEQAVAVLFSLRCRVSGLCSEIRQPGLAGIFPLPSHRVPLPRPLAAACNLPLQI